MKIGVDGVLLGAWADVVGKKRILDVGTGCGVIALMCAQRNAEARVTAIDTDPPSIGEAALNFKDSPWPERLEALLEDYNTFPLTGFDLIISNPPYFDSGIDNPESPRLKARHQGALSPKTIVEKASRLLNPGGTIAMVFPAEILDRFREDISSTGFGITRICRVRGHAQAPVKRVLVELASLSEERELVEENLTLEERPGEPTEEYRTLCRDFYLYF